MLILALDTTTRAGSVAVTRDDEVLCVVNGDASRTHGERLPEEIDLALRQAGVEMRALTLLVVASGPGAFTGLRIGLAAIQGLAMVTGIPVVGVSALDALAKLAGEQMAVPGGTEVPPHVIVWMDAQRGEVFGARYSVEPGTVPAPLEDPYVSTPDAILASLDSTHLSHATFAGDGAIRYRAAIDGWSRGAARVIEPVPPLAPWLAWIGRRRAAAGAAGPPHALQPLYVRRSDAEIERGRRGDG